MQARHSARLAAAIGTLAVLPLAVAVGAEAAPQGKLKAKGGVEVVSRVQAAKSASGRIAKTDPRLLGRHSRAPSTSSSSSTTTRSPPTPGGIKGLPATNPAVTGTPLGAKSPAVRGYTDYIKASEQRFLAALDARSSVRAARARSCAPSTAASR